MKACTLIMFLWGLSCALPVARYQNTETESSEEWKDHLAQSPAPPTENSESSEESKVSSEEQANVDPSDSVELEDDLASDDRQYVYRPAGGLSRSTGKEDDKDDDEDDSGDDTFGDEDNGPWPEERTGGGISRADGDDSVDATRSSEESASPEDSAQDSTSESRDLDHEDDVGSRPRGDDFTQESESEEHWVGGGSEGESSHGDGSEFDDEGMQSDDPDSIRSERGNSRMSSVGVKSKESKRDSEQVSPQDSGESQLVEYPSRKFFRKSRISEEDGGGELNGSNTMEEVKSDSISKESGLSQSREDSRSESQEDSKESQSQEDSENTQDPSSESSQEADLASPESSSSESQEEVVSESRGDNPDNVSSAGDQEDSDSSQEDSLNTFSSSESESREEQADSESNESLKLSEESPESSEDENSSSQEGVQSQSASTESQSDESQSEQDSPSEEEADSDSQDSSRSREDSNSTESTSSSEEDGQPKNMEGDSRKLTVDAYHNKPIGDQDDNDCQDGY